MQRSLGSRCCSEHHRETYDRKARQACRHHNPAEFRVNVHSILKTVLTYMCLLHQLFWKPCRRCLAVFTIFQVPRLLCSRFPGSGLWESYMLGPLCCVTQRCCSWYASSHSQRSTHVLTRDAVCMYFCTYAVNMRQHHLPLEALWQVGLEAARHQACTGHRISQPSPATCYMGKNIQEIHMTRHLHDTNHTPGNMAHASPDCMDSASVQIRSSQSYDLNTVYITCM